MLTWVWVAIAAAGEVFFVDTVNSSVNSLDVRSMATLPVENIGFIVATTGLAYQRPSDTLWVYSPGTVGLVGGYTGIDLPSFALTNLGPFSRGASALAYDPVSDSVLAVDRAGVWAMPDAQAVLPALVGPGLDTYGADWFDDGGYIVAVEKATGDFYAIVPGGAPVFLAPAAPSPGPRGPHGLAYDSDTRTFLFFTVGAYWLIEPESFSVVGFVMMDRFMDGAAGSIDDVPAQTPELLVTGSCTGTMYVTVVDATPGGHVVIGSSARRGRKTVASGPCAGAQLDLRSPTPRYDLVANSYGIASTTVAGTPGMCGGAQLLQAMDVDTCLVTTVKPMQTAFFP